MQEESFAQAIYRIGLLGCVVLLATGCAGRRYYADVRLVPDPRSMRAPGLRAALLDEIPPALTQAGIKRVAVVTPEGVHRVLDGRSDPPSLTAVPTASLAALKAALSEEARGAEIDLLLPGEHGEPVAVSAHYEPNGTIVITQGPPLPASKRTPPTADEVRARHGITPSDLGEVRWTAPYLEVFDRALALLGNEEKAFVSRILFVREHRSREPANQGVNVVALYTSGAGAARIELYDNLIAADRYMFIGQPHAPQPASVRAILHQIGHALAEASQAAAQRDLMSAVSAYQSDEKKLSQWIESREGEAPTEEQVGDFLDKIHRVEVTSHRVQHVGPEGPVIRAFRRARGNSSGPTLASESDVEESFADSFALFRSDPEALRRIDADALTWFGSHGHLSALGQ